MDDRHEECKMIKWMHRKGITSDQMYKLAAVHVVGATLLWIEAERSGDATKQRRAIALSLCPPIYQLWGVALRHEEATG
jgi:hypothetical protein